MAAGQESDGRLALKIGRPLGENLMADGIITGEQLDRGLREAKTHHELLGQTLVRLGWATSDQILWALAKQAGIEVVDLDSARRRTSAIWTASTSSAATRTCS
jgi:hypothetical protein